MSKTFKGAFVFMLVMLIALAGCGKSAPSASSGADANANPAGAAVDAKPENQPLVELTVATVGDSATFAPIYFAQEAELWAKYGLKVKRVSLDAAASVAAAVSGDVQIVLDGPGVIDAALKTDKIRVIGTYGKIAYSLYSKNISTLEEIKGKTIGSTAPGGANDYVTRTMIRSVGLQQGKDVKILYAGGAPAILAAINEGKIEAGLISPPVTIQAELMGLKQVVNMNDVKGVLGMYGVMGVYQPFAEKHPQAVEHFMKAYVEAGKLMRADKAATLPVLEKHMKVIDPKVLDVSYEVYKDLWPADLHLPESEIEFLFGELSEKNPLAKTKKPADVTDYRYADAAK